MSFFYWEREYILKKRAANKFFLPENLGTKNPSRFIYEVLSCLILQDRVLSINLLLSEPTLIKAYMTLLFEPLSSPKKR